MVQTGFCFTQNLFATTLLKTLPNCNSVLSVLNIFVFLHIFGLVFLLAYSTDNQRADVASTNLIKNF